MPIQICGSFLLSFYARKGLWCQTSLTKRANFWTGVVNQVVTLRLFMAEKEELNSDKGSKIACNYSFHTQGQRTFKFISYEILKNKLWRNVLPRDLKIRASIQPMNLQLTD